MEAEIPGGSVSVIDLLSLFRIIYPGIYTMVYGEVILRDTLSPITLQQIVKVQGFSDRRKRLYRQYAPPYLFVFLKPDLWQPATGLPDTKGHVVLVYLHYTVYYSKARWLARGIGSQIPNRYGV